jgi:hypothetical protein
MMGAITPLLSESSRQKNTQEAPNGTQQLAVLNSMIQLVGAWVVIL